MHQSLDRRVPAEAQVAHEHVLDRHAARRDHDKAKLAVVDLDDLDAFLFAPVEDVLADRPGDGTIRRHVTADNACSFLIDRLFNIGDNHTKGFCGLGGGYACNRYTNGYQLRHDFLPFYPVFKIISDFRFDISHVSILNQTCVLKTDLI